ncbi:DHHW family protein [Ruminococcus sp. Marseille-P6503]|uniref:DHHW family protein n=1 Tax=Ruminococcus sp. Marseille-P6503 TaxID=2364796 RepID=UPI000F5248A9|nr:DHHW family protein [Ruminococcus sp. Marseille-P6503]
MDEKAIKRENGSESGGSGGRVADIIMLSVFLIFIFGFTLASIIAKDREFSEMENRNLAQKPEFSFKNLKEGKFTGDIESYLSDQLFLKDALVSLKTDCDRAALKTSMNGIYFSDGGYLIQQYTQDMEQINENIGYINDWAENISCPVDFILVPDAVSVLSDKLPSSAVNDDQMGSMAAIASMLSPKISLYNPYQELKQLSDSGTQAYYKTDHHWTSEGAKTVYDWYMKSSGQEPSGISYGVETISGFYGTLYSKAPSAFTEPDELHIYSNPDGEYTVERTNDGTVTDSLYDRSFLDKKDKYSAFLGGNFARLKISSNAASDEKALILKDSYANAIVPFLADSYSEITMIDLRYYHFAENTVSELIDKYDIDRVILIYNMDFINSDQNFIWLS